MPTARLPGSRAAAGSETRKAGLKSLQGYPFWVSPHAPGAVCASARSLPLISNFSATFPGLRDDDASYVVGLVNMHALAMGIQLTVSPLRGYAIFAPSSFREIQRATDRGTVITLSGTGNTFRDTDLADYLRACPGPGVCS